MKNIMRSVALQLGVLEPILMMRSGLEYRNDNKKFLIENKDFTPPPRKILFDILGKASYRMYHEDGLHNAVLIASWIRESLGKKQDIRICDWGCGPGRVAKHLPAMLADMRPEYYGTDCNDEAIQWCRKNIAGVSFSTNKLEPSLDFPENYFDFLLARSVFTHLSEKMHKLWLDELLRVTKHGGFILLTTHGNSFRQHLQEQEKQQFDQGHLVTVLGAAEGRRDFIAFHNPDYCRTVFLKDQNIVRYLDGSVWDGRTQQDVWFIQKQNLIS